MASSDVPFNMTPEGPGYNAPYAQVAASDGPSTLDGTPRGPGYEAPYLIIYGPNQYNDVLALPADTVPPNVTPKGPN